MGLEAVFSSAVAGEVLGSQNHGLLVGAVGAVLIAVNQSGDDGCNNSLTLTVGVGVTGPAGIGDQVDLGAVHHGDALAAPHLTVNLCELTDHVSVDNAILQVGVADNGGSTAQLIGEAHCDGVGALGVGDEGDAFLGCLPLDDGVSNVVVQGNQRSVLLQAAAVDAATDTTVGQNLVVAACEVGSFGVVLHQVLGLLTLGNDGHDLRNDDVAVLVNGLFQLVGVGGDHQGVQNKTSLVCQSHLADQVSSTLCCGQLPVLEIIELMVVVHVLIVLAILDDDTNGGNTDGGAVLVLVVLGLQVGLGGVNLVGIVGSCDVLNVLSHGYGSHGSDHGQCQQEANNFLHVNEPLLFLCE